MSNQPSEEKISKRAKSNNVVEDGSGSEVKKSSHINNNNNNGSESAYTWKEVHEDLDNNKFAGVHGGSNAAYFGLAELRAKLDLDRFHTKRSPDEFHIPALDKHIKLPQTQRKWGDICTIDPMGMYANRPTMAATTAEMTIPELTNMERDGKVVNADGTVNIVKCAIDYVWNLPMFAKRLGFPEDQIRKALFKYTQNEHVLDTTNRVFLPPVGGMTVYFFGDITRLSEKSTEVAVRVHDQCTGSDVFGTDICTCRPYLVFALDACIKCAQRGGVGIVVYFQKEGRSLGEVTKFRVYNARRSQKGGDRAETYFYQTETIAGIRDARFQEMMPDVLLWLGVTRIDWLLSMSSDKYDAITGAGIEVMQRVSLPDKLVPKNAHVEINAKISAGYHTDCVNNEEVIDRMRGLKIIRERCGMIMELAKQNKTKHFELHLERLDDTARLVIDEIKSNYPDQKVPYHSRWRHFPSDQIEALKASWACDPVEKARRLIDLVTISVLLDAGAGNQWKYRDTEGRTYSRSEGIARATLDMFKKGMFSSDVATPHRVNSYGLLHLDKDEFVRGFQVNSQDNPMTGLEGRFKLIKRLGKALKDNTRFFGQELFRPGNVVDYVLQQVKDNRVSIKVLWKAVIEGFESIWPNTLSGIRRGDIWIYSSLKKVGQPGSDMIPFHKLSQWLALSMLEPIEELGVKWDDLHKFTGLAEYRNGGLFIDAGVLTLRDPNKANFYFDVGAELVVEWRALTVCLLDMVAERVRALTGAPLSLPQILQGGTWSAGRALARKLRPEGVPPIQIRSDGSVF